MYTESNWYVQSIYYRFVDGEIFMSSVADAIMAAKEEIYITDWMWVDWLLLSLLTDIFVSNLLSPLLMAFPSSFPLLPFPHLRMSPHIYLKRDPPQQLEWRMDKLLLKRAVS